MPNTSTTSIVRRTRVEIQYGVFRLPRTLCETQALRFEYIYRGKNQSETAYAFGSSETATVLRKWVVWGELSKSQSIVMDGWLF